MNVVERSISKSTERPASVAWMEALAATADIGKHPRRLLADLISGIAAETPNAPALLSDRESFSFRALAQRADAYFRWVGQRGLKRGDRVALMMGNRPEYVALWMGLSRAGVVVALINTSLSGRSLAHCLGVAGPRYVIVDDPYLETVKSGMAALDGAVLVPHDEMAKELSQLQGSDEAVTRPAVSIDDTALLIYTSGTTGLPKAARVSHRRILSWALWFKGLLGNTPSDRMYDCLPLYHSVGGVVAVAATLVAGGSTVIAEKFSASRFWSDVRRWNCTQVQYIGELCRYLLNAATMEGEQEHRLRLACGNGLRQDIWRPFQERFGIPQIVEFYAATEGSFSLFNVEGKPGAIGRIPPFLRHRFPVAIVRFDPEMGCPLRGKDGLCIRADRGEAGEMIGRIGSGEDGNGRFEGYTDVAESERKILHDVFALGDAWFRTGDLARLDAAGFYSFVDRTGDTFRWKGENVSTLEVANVLSLAPGIRDVTVYGVAVPGCEGKAGMALLDIDDEFSIQRFWQEVESQLPLYAIPLFIRMGSKLSLTETFKHRKQELVSEGFDPSRIDDDLYVRLGREGFVRLDAALHQRICAGAVLL